MSLIESALAKLRRGETEAGSPETLTRSSRTGEGEPPAKIATLPERVQSAPPPARRIKVDLKGLRAAGYLPEESVERRFADHYRQIKRPLIEKAHSGAAEMRLIMVTSALPGDGKTFTSINLALSMARERDISVLLVDADAPRAHVSAIFGLSDQPGLLDALTDESLDVEALIVDTDVPGLQILPAGRRVEHATELLASARMSQVAGRMGTRDLRRLVLFDTAPLLASSEARAILRIPGQVALVARAGVTPRQALVDALAYVDRTKLQGLILNHVRVASGSGYYEYPSYSGGGDRRADEH